MNILPIFPRNVEFNNINFNIKKKTNGKINILLTYNNQEFIIQTPDLYQEINTIIDKDNFYELNINIIDKYNKKNLFYDFLEKLDKFFINYITNNTKLFDNHKIKYKSILRKSNNIDRYIKIKLLKENIINNNLKIICNNNLIDINNLKGKSTIKMLLDINAIWINQNNCGIYIKPIIINKSITKEFSFINETENNILESDVDTNSKSITEPKFNNKLEKISEDSVLNNNIHNNNNLNKTNVKENRVLSSSINNTNKYSISNTNKSNIITNKYSIDNDLSSTSSDEDLSPCLNNNIDDDMTTVNYNQLSDIVEYNNN
tara:strand:+ start:1753 stop:2703 length:951 start_codon:yes stop_codon:yes gene_type:complete